MKFSIKADTNVCARILVVEDDPGFADIVCRILGDDPRFLSVTLAADLASARVALDQQGFDIVVLDLQLPDGNGIELTPLIPENCRAVVVTIFGNETAVIEALAAGANGYLLKDEANIADSIIKVLRGDTPLSASVAAHLVANWRHMRGQTDGQPAGSDSGDLSPRETETLQALAEGLSYNEAAGRLGISPHTIADHIKSIYRKLAVNSRAGAVYEGLKSGIVSVS